MVSDDRRLQLNRNFFRGQVHRQWQAYTDPRPTFEQRLCRSRLESAVATVHANVASGGRVLDVGCGTGEFCHRLTELGFITTGIDFLDEMLEVARRRGSSIEWLHAPFSDKIGGKRAFDAITALGYLEYQERAGKELVRMNRLLKPGGLLILSVPNTLSARFAFGLKRAAYRVGKEPETTNIRHSFTPERLQRLLGMAGFIFLDYLWVDPNPSEPVALSPHRRRPFWRHRIRDRLQPELLTLSRSYSTADLLERENVSS